MAETTPEETSDAKKKSDPKRYTDWHRIAGGLFAHTFEEPAFSVVVDFDVATTEKMVDIVVQILKDDLSNVPLLAKGFDSLNKHNLFTFKSYQESFDYEAIEELIAYFNLYLKTKAPSGSKELDRSLVRLFALCVRKPTGLLGNHKIRSEKIDEGVYDVEYGVTQFRLVAVNELELKEENANLLLFSNLRDRVEYGKKNHSLAQTKYTSLMNQLLKRYEEEGDQDMVDILNPTEEEVYQDLAETPRVRKTLLKVFRREEFIDEFLEEVPTEKRLEGIPTEKRLEGIPTEKRLEGIPTEKRLEGVAAADVLKGLSPEQLAELAKLINKPPEAN